MKTALRWLLTVVMVAAGVNHFLVPEAYAATIPAWTLWARLPLQAVLVAWAWWYARADRRA